jgi:hypothetical protein
LRCQHQLIHFLVCHLGSRCPLEGHTSDRTWGGAEDSGWLVVVEPRTTFSDTSPTTYGLGRLRSEINPENFRSEYRRAKPQRRVAIEALATRRVRPWRLGRAAAWTSLSRWSMDKRAFLGHYLGVSTSGRPDLHRASHPLLDRCTSPRGRNAGRRRWRSTRFTRPQRPRWRGSAARFRPLPPGGKNIQPSPKAGSATESR